MVILSLPPSVWGEDIGWQTGLLHSSEVLTLEGVCPSKCQKGRGESRGSGARRQISMGGYIASIRQSQWSYLPRIWIEEVPRRVDGVT